MEASRSTYSYTPLDESRRQIRVLHLQPRTKATPLSAARRKPGTTMGISAATGIALAIGISSSELRCSLRIVSLNDSPEFEALSYVWGDPKTAKVVILDGHEFAVTANLHLALTHLQHPERERIIWVDALCINQGDVQERTSQVAQMVDVFGAASATVAFLGPNWPGFDIMIDYVEMLGKDPMLHFDHDLEPHARCHDLTMSSERLRDYIVYFFTLPWHKRIWTVQEYAQSKRIVFQCGNLTLDGGLLRLYLDNLRAHLASCCSAGEMYPAWTTWGFEVMYKMRKADFDLVLALFCDRHCYDPRDKIYGLWGYGPAKQQWLQLRPDYNLSTATLYKKVVEASIDIHKTLDVLSFTCGSRQLALGLPSFVPDWTATRSPAEFDSFTNRYSVILAASYNACKKSEPQFSVSASGVGLTPGILIDTIAVVDQGDYASDRERLEDHYRLALLTDTSKVVYQSRSNAFWRNMFGNVAIVTDVSHVELRDLTPSDESTFQSWERWTTFGVGMGPSDTGVGWEERKFERTHTAVSALRNFFVSDKGYIGWAPKASVKGDQIVILPGGRVPYILRRDNVVEVNDSMTVDAQRVERYTFIGDAYVHGMMHGELYDETKLKDITLV